MGSYTNLSVAGYPVLESKSTVVPEAMTIFRETDRRVFTRRVSERSVLVWGVPENPDDSETETAVEYSCETGNVIDRLNVMGFTLDRVRKEFESGRKAELAKFDSWAEGDQDRNWFADEWNLVKNLTFDSYVSGFRTVMTQRLRPRPFDDHERPDLEPVVKYILGENDEYLFGFFGDDIRLLLRVACDLVPRESRVVQDITELVHAGYYEESEPVCEIVTQALVAGHPENSPRIVLTEGSTDATILKEALALLYPHLAGYYSFLDFDSSRSPGGAGYLVSVVKAFAGAGITNRIVALFDNDTAAREAVRVLGAVSLPPNIAVRHYPELDMLRAYPTLGPGGVASLNVNGLAGSIELYLGNDVLRDSQGALIPVQWKGYSEALRQYQGEVLQKASIRSAFAAKCARCERDPTALQGADWVGLRGILEAIFCAFD
jgi:HEPN/Toprim N-terminal domain 1